MDYKDYKKLLGLKIKLTRKNLKKTQETFCDEIGLEVPNLSNIENGKSYPSMQTILNIINTYKIEPNEFFNFINWNETQKDEIVYEIDEYLKSLSKDLKIHILEIVKNLNE